MIIVLHGHFVKHVWDWRCRRPRHRQGLWVRSSLSVLVIVLAVIIVFGVAVIGVAVIGIDIIVLVVVV